MKTAIVTAYNDRYSPVGDVTSQVAHAYAMYHGHDFICWKNDWLSEGRPPAWGKVRAIQQALETHDWVFWIDADAMFLDLKYDIRELIDEKYSIILAAEPLPEGLTINTGVAWYKKHHTTNFLLKKTWDQEDCINHSWWEQGAMISVLRQYECYNDLVKKLPTEPINVHPSKLTPNSKIVHIAGGSGNPEHKGRIMNSLLDGIMK